MGMVHIINIGKIGLHHNRMEYKMNSVYVIQDKSFDMFLYHLYVNHDGTMSYSMGLTGAFAKTI